jgi:hypothetical protein
MQPLLVNTHQVAIIALFRVINRYVGKPVDTRSPPGLSGCGDPQIEMQSMAARGAAAN